MPFPDSEKQATIEAIADPQVGDRFQEFYAFWLYVIKRDGDIVTTIEASAPCTFPEDGNIKTMSLQEFYNRLVFSAGPWVRLAGRGHDVEGWI